MYSVSLGCVCVFIYVYLTYTSMYLYGRMLDGVHVYVECMCRTYCICIRVSLSVRWHVAAIRTRYGRSGYVFVVDLIHRQFEDRSTGWFVDQYQFEQWRPDGDSVPKPRHFMWAFILVHFLIYRCRYAFTCYTYHIMWLSVIFEKSPKGGVNRWFS